MGTPEKYFGSLFDFATRIKSKEALNHPAFAEEEKSLGEYQKILQQFQDEHPDLFKELKKKRHKNKPSSFAVSMIERPFIP